MPGIWLAYHDQVGATVLRYCTGDLEIRQAHGFPTVVAEVAGRSQEITVARLRAREEAERVVWLARAQVEAGEVRVLDIAALEDEVRTAGAGVFFEGVPA